MKLDVHHLFLKDALEEIVIKFDECVELGDNFLEIVHEHEHKHGTVIRDYIRSSRFLKETARNGYKIVSKNFSDGGVTIFQLEPPKNKSKINSKSKSSSSEIMSENKIPINMCLKCKE